MTTSNANRGRPKDPERQAKTKNSLIQAASQTLKHKLYCEISIREIAAIAGVNSAMISYHFGGKEALFLAVIQQSIGEQRLKDLRQQVADESLCPEQKLRKLITVFMSIHQDSPWLSRLIADQVVIQKGKLGDLFIEHIILRNERIIVQLIKQFIAEGYFRKDLNCEYTRTSLLSLLAFPFLCASMIERAFGVDFYQQDINSWVDHTLTLFLSGCKSNGNS